MQLSIIIVNYNVKHFLEQCLYSLQKACQGISAEVWVVDNASTDDSLAYLKPLFAWVNWVEAGANLGFSRANNLALEHCTGKWVLFLNPDTLVPEDCLQQCLAFAEEHPKLGALGIKMVDGSGRFLPESKRAFPGPLTSFYKLTGLSALFPQSPTLARYHLGHLSPHQNWTVDVLAGAFMWVRRQVLLQVGSFDEQFFMYGEDIDLSYRIQAAGWQNWYFANSAIVHFKGESTKKGSLNYVRMFYQAMHLFVGKHYRGGKAVVFRLFIKLAIMLRALASATSRIVKKWALPLLDAALTILIMLGIYTLWYQYVRPDVSPEPWVKNFAIPIFAVVFISTAALAGLYDYWYKPGRTFKAMLAAIVLMMALYSLLPESYRFSRAITLLSGLAAAGCILLLRQVLAGAGWQVQEDEEQAYRQTMLAGSPAACAHATALLEAGGLAYRKLGQILLTPASPQPTPLQQIVTQQYQNSPFKELVFCMDDYLGVKQVIEMLQNLRLPVTYLFAALGSHSLVGSHSSHTAGTVWSSLGAFALSKPWQQRNKRILDLAVSLLLVLAWPAGVLISSRYRALARHIGAVLAGRKTWVGYIGHQHHQLPKIAPSVLACNGLLQPLNNAANTDIAWAINERYARGYTWNEDASILIAYIRSTGKQPV